MLTKLLQAFLGNDTVAPFLLVSPALNENSFADQKKSPFSAYKEECHFLVKPEKYTGKDEAEFLLQNNVIGTIDIEMMRLINHHLALTSKQIYDLLATNYANITQADVQRKLKLLAKKSFVNKIGFSTQAQDERLTSGSRAAFYAYTIGYHGKNTLLSLEVQPRLLGYVNAMPCHRIKATLAANQFFIALGKQEAVAYTLRQMIICDAQTEAIIRSNALFYFEEKPYFLEVVRQEEGWKERFEERLSRYAKVQKSYKTSNIQLKCRPAIVFVAEDSQHAQMVQCILEQNKQLQELFLTFDTNTNYSEKSIVEFVAV